MTTSSLSGNADHNLSIELPSGVSSSDIEAVFYLGATPASSWNTTPFVKGIDNAQQGVWKVGIHTLGATAQAYTLRFMMYKKS